MTLEQEQNVMEIAKLSETVSYIIATSNSTGLSIECLCETLAAMATRRKAHQTVVVADEDDYQNSLYETYEEEAEANGGYSNES